MNGLGYPRRGLHGRVVGDLGLRIVAGAWPSGAPLPNEDELAAELGVSRTVVREAIKVLQAKGLVEVKPRTGTRVRPRRAWHLLDADVVAWQFADMERGEDLRELYEIRSTIETTAARLAAERRTDEQLSEIDAHQRRIAAAAAEPIALRAAELDFHDAIVDGRPELAAVARRRDDPRCTRGRRRPARTRPKWSTRRCSAPRWQRRSAPAIPTRPKRRCARSSRSAGGGSSAGTSHGRNVNDRAVRAGPLGCVELRRDRACTR